MQASPAQPGLATKKLMHSVISQAGNYKMCQHCFSRNHSCFAAGLSNVAGPAVQQDSPAE
jgi:hypothetical protein